MRATVAFTLLAAAPAQAPWTSAQMAADLRQLVDAVRSDWSYLEDRTRRGEVDLGRLLADAEAALPAVASADDFARVLRRLVAGLHDGHASVRLPGASPPAARLPFRLVDCAEGLLVVQVAAGVAEPQRGDLLLAIDGTPVADLLAAAATEVAASTPGMRRRLAIERLQHGAAAKRRCTFAAADGATLEVELAPLAPGADLPPARQAATNWSLSWPRPRIAMLRIASFAVEDWQGWLRAAPEQREPFLQATRARIDAIVDQLRTRADALVLDLRGNGGGTDLLGIHLAERLLARPFRYFQLSAKHRGRWLPPAGITYGTGAHARFAGRVVALVDSGCFSTTDNFVRCLDDLHPAFTVVGRPTGGGSGAPRQLAVGEHTGAALRACTQRVYGPRGRLIEGHGTEPDVAVQWTRADWLGGGDPDLAAALAQLAADRDADRDAGRDAGRETGKQARPSARAKGKAPAEPGPTRPR